MNSDNMSLEKAREAIQKHISCANVEELVCSNTECPNCEFGVTYEEFMQALEIALEVLDEKIDETLSPCYNCYNDCSNCIYNGKL